MSGKFQNKLATILLVFVVAQLIAPAILFFSIALVKNAQQKQIRENHLEPAFFEKLTLSSTDYQNLVFIDKKEIIYNGALYDLHSVTRTGEQYILLALPDKAEAKLKEISAKIANPVQNAKLSTLLVAITFLYFEQAHDLLPKTAVQVPGFTPRSMQLAQTHFPVVPTPPPDPSF